MLETEKEWLEGRLNIGHEFLYLTRAECIAAGPDIDETLALIRRVLEAHGRKECEMPAKIGIHPFQEVFFHAMPAYVPSMKACGCKWIECYPNNPQKYKLPQTTSLLTLNEIMTGCPMAVMDGTWITAMRTPAVTAIAAVMLHPKAESFGMFGCGVQGIEHVRFIAKTLPNLKVIFVYDIRPEAMDRLCEEVRDSVTIPVVKAANPREAAVNCQVMSSATLIVKEPVAVVKDEWIDRGRTILPCDLNTFWDPRTQRRADKYIVDSAEEHELFAKMGYFPDGLPKIHAQTGEVLAGIAKGRENDDELIVCSNIGMSVCDVVMAQAILTKALEMGLGVKLPF